MPSFNLIHHITISMSYCAFFAASLAAALYLIQDGAIKSKLAGAVFNRLPSLSFLDRLNYRSIALGFPILTLAILSGFMWTKNIYGVYWHTFNSRHLYALALWLVYALILHVRLTAGLRGRKVAVLSLAAFVIGVITLFGTCR